MCCSSMVGRGLEEETRDMTEDNRPGALEAGTFFCDRQTGKVKGQRDNKTYITGEHT